MTARHLSRICKQTAKAAAIDKNVSMHTLRHSFATDLLEAKVDIRLIQVLFGCWGHAQLNSTARYTQVATNLLKEVINPLDTITLQKKRVRTDVSRSWHEKSGKWRMSFEHTANSDVMNIRGV
jgi:integrase/recombinase XerD